MYLRKLMLLLASLILLQGCVTKSAKEMQELVETQAEELLKQLQKTDVVELDSMQAVDMALQNNLQLRIESREAEIRKAFSKAYFWDMLPDIRGSLQYSNRDQPRASRSVSADSGNQSLEPSISGDEESRTSRVELTWSSLDFGIAYMKRHQGKAEDRIREFAGQRAQDDIIKQTMQVYRQAYAYQQLQKRYKEPAKNVRQMLKVAEELTERRQQARGYISNYQRRLIDKYRQLVSALSEASDAEYRLKALLDIPVSQPLELAAPAASQKLGPLQEMSYEELILVALINRPDIWQVMYESEIDLSQRNEEILRLLPNISASYGLLHDSNSFLEDREWNEFNANTGFGVFRLFSAWKRYRLAKRLEKLTPLKVAAVMSATAVQLKISQNQLTSSESLYCAAQDFKRMEEREQEYILRSTRTGINNTFDKTLSDVNVLLADYNSVLEEGKVEQARMMLLQTLGVSLSEAYQLIYSGKSSDDLYRYDDVMQRIHVPDEEVREKWVEQWRQITLNQQAAEQEELVPGLCI